MACSGCQARRDWIKKWTKIAYERATGKRTAESDGSSDTSNGRSDSGNKSTG